VPGERADVLGDLRAAGRALRRAPEALHLVAADLACSAVYGAQTVLLVLVARRVTGGDGGYGLLLGAYGIGGLAGAAFAARTRAPSRRVLAFGLLAVAAPLPLLGLTSSLPVALGLALAGGGGGVMAEVLSETALQRALPEAVLGGAFGLVVPASLAGIVAGALVAAPLAAAFGLAGALTAIAAAVLLLLGALTVSRPAAPAAVAV
jgi:predicted MFS family arabinose efflux permease